VRSSIPFLVTILKQNQMKPNCTDFFSTQLGDELEARSLLARTVHHTTVVVCTSNGAVIPPRATAQIAERAGYATWAPPSSTTAAADTPTATDNTETKRLTYFIDYLHRRYHVRLSYRCFLPCISSLPAFLSCQCTRGPFRCITTPHPPSSVAH
jgi:hypothetical protein